MKVNFHKTMGPVTTFCIEGNGKQAICLTTEIKNGER